MAKYLDNFTGTGTDPYLPYEPDDPGLHEVCWAGINADSGAIFENCDIPGVIPMMLLLVAMPQSEALRRKYPTAGTPFYASAPKLAMLATDGHQWGWVEENVLVDLDNDDGGDRGMLSPVDQKVLAPLFEEFVLWLAGCGETPSD